MPHRHRIINIHFFALILVVFLVAACGSGTQAVANETWSLVELLTKGERTDIVTEIIEARNCGVVERKTIDCSAGTSNELNVSFGGSVGGGEGFRGEIGASVSSGLGIGRNSGESLTLDLPPEGFAYRYTVKKEFRVLAGEVLARSSAGSERKAAYAFHASCSLRIESRETLACQGGIPLPTQSPPTQLPTTQPPPTQLPTIKPTNTFVSPTSMLQTYFASTAAQRCRQEFHSEPIMRDSITFELVDQWRRIGKTDWIEVAKVIYCEIHQVPGFKGFVEGNEIPANVIITADLGFNWKSMYPGALERLVHEGGGWGVFLSLKPFVVQHASDLPNDVGGQYWFISK